MEWIKREGTQTERPADLDITSSATTVYQRRNQKQEEREKNYQTVIEKLTESFRVLNEVQKDLQEIKDCILTTEKKE